MSVAHFCGALAAALLLAQKQDPVKLTASQWAAIDRGESVVLSRLFAESPWPAVTVYVFIDAAPEEAAAVFIDYDRHQTYIPGVKQSRVARVVDRATIEVDYRVELPIASDEEYTVRNHVRVDRPGSYRVDWVLIRATSVKATTGYARFAAYSKARGRSGTLLEYHNVVTPGSRLAGLPFVRNHAVRQIEETARAVAQRTEKEREKAAALAQRVAALRAAVAPLRESR